jgi:hypothetical protein
VLRACVLRIGVWAYCVWALYFHPGEGGLSRTLRIARPQN